MVNFYEILGCPENASYEELKTCYQNRVRKLHPDKANTQPDGNQAQCVDNHDLFVQVTEAWNTLRDSSKRKAYDAELLASKCSTPLIHDTLTWDELNLNGDVCTYPCRCGSFYSIPVTEKYSCDSDFAIQCSECSLHILVKQPSELLENYQSKFQNRRGKWFEDFAIQEIEGFGVREDRFDWASAMKTRKVKWVPYFN